MTQNKVTEADSAIVIVQKVDELLLQGRRNDAFSYVGQQRNLYREAATAALQKKVNELEKFVKLLSIQMLPEEIERDQDRDACDDADFKYSYFRIITDARKLLTKHKESKDE